MKKATNTIARIHITSAPLTHLGGAIEQVGRKHNAGNPEFLEEPGAYTGWPEGSNHSSVRTDAAPDEGEDVMHADDLVFRLFRLFSGCRGEIQPAAVEVDGVDE